MSLKLQLIIGLIIVFMMILIINSIRNKMIDLKYALTWLVLGIILFILDVFPNILFKMASLIGIEIPSNMIFFVGLIFVVVLIYSLTASISRLSNKVKRLTQEIALLREEMERLKK